LPPAVRWVGEGWNPSPDKISWAERNLTLGSSPPSSGRTPGSSSRGTALGLIPASAGDNTTTAMATWSRRASPPPGRPRTRPAGVGMARPAEAQGANRRDFI